MVKYSLMLLIIWYVATYNISLGNFSFMRHTCQLKCTGNKHCYCFTCCQQSWSSRQEKTALLPHQETLHYLPKWLILRFILWLSQIGSPTALANLDVENRLRQKASSGSHGVYISSGALWGGSDIKKMADRRTLKVIIIIKIIIIIITITMTSLFILEFIYAQC